MRNRGKPRTGKDKRRKVAADQAKKCPGCGYPTADGTYCGECLCEDDCAP